MNPAQNNSSPNDQQNTQPAVPAIISSTTAKEQGGARVSSAEVVSEIKQEVELPKEVEKAGVEIVKDTIELPPDIKKLGVTSTGSIPSVTASVSLPQVTLPISDQQVEVGLHAQILSSLRWLAVWCVRRLKMAHIALKQIHGKIVRVKD
ncbi:hypothetical protein HY029_05525 [Candidatus Gottesmanbacteria bacterium]|nr:hypothetical protein [Candidatus Gottesmanbacteria bacterium]